MTSYEPPNVTHYGDLTRLTGVISPSTKADFDLNTGDEGEGSFNVTPVD